MGTSLSNNFRFLSQSFLGMVLFGAPGLSSIRKNYYRRTFNMGPKCTIGSGVIFAASHDPSPDSVHIGEHVHIAGNVFIDYSGGLTIGNDVSIGRQSMIYTHRHMRHTARVLMDEGVRIVREDADNQKTPLTIEDGAFIAVRSIIMPGVSYIGKNAVVSAGSVVTKSVPDNTIVAGNPAQIVFQKKK